MNPYYLTDEEATLIRIALQRSAHHYAGEMDLPQLRDDYYRAYDVMTFAGQSPRRTVPEADPSR